MLRRGIAGLVLLGLLQGCASAPKVTAYYYFPKAQTNLVVTQTITCISTAGQAPVIQSVAAVSATTTYSSDLSPDITTGKPRMGHLNYADLAGTFSDADTTMSFTDDGRLSGINAASTGEGGAIIKAGLTIAAAAIIPFDLTSIKPRSPDPTLACKIIKQYSATDPTKTPTVSLTYSLLVDYPERPQGNVLLQADGLNPGDYDHNFLSKIILLPDENSEPIYDKLFAALPNLYFQVAIGPSPTLLARPVWADADDKGTPTIDLNEVAMINLNVNGPSGDVLRNGPAWTTSVPIPLTKAYQLPVPASILFGKEGLGLTLSSYGSVSKLEYSENTGVTDLAGAAGNIATAAEPKTPEQQAAVLQGQSDLIYQQQRLIACQTSPASCSSK